MATQIQMPELRYGLSDLAPVISEETLNYHYGKHLQTYVNQLNTLIEATEYEDMVLADIIREAPAGPLFNNAGQVFNHAMYFEQFAAPVKEGEENLPTEALEEAIYASFGDFETFRQLMSDAALKLFGSGWAWLVQTENGSLKIEQYPNADNPLKHDQVPLLCIDVWEHAYYLDYQNRRAEYIQKIWNIIDWEIVAARMSVR
jgi:Fe-Mn family superoxide dismutase